MEGLQLLGSKLVRLKSDIELLQSKEKEIRAEIEKILPEGSTFTFESDGKTFALTRTKMETRILESNQIIKGIIGNSEFIRIAKVTISALEEFGKETLGLCVKKYETSYPLKLREVKR